MDIACPSCATLYEVDEATLPDTGRRVRCAACGEVWRAFRAEAVEATEVAPEATVFTDTPETAADADAPGEPASAPLQEEPFPARGATIIRNKPGKKAKAPGLLRKLATWPVAACVVGAVLVAGAVHQRARVVAAFPQSAKLYAAAGLPVNLRGIEIANVKSRLVEDNGVSILVVDGDLKNVAGRKVDVPRLRFAVLGAMGEEIYIWSAQADRPNLNAGEALNFRRRLASPPEGAKDVSVRFLTAGDITSGLK
ncbi:MAG: zinc-ribbon domain-containing protein [Beijerinckiaceae bacterium]